MHVGTGQPLWPAIHETVHTRGSGHNNPGDPRPS